MEELKREQDHDCENDDDCGGEDDYDNDYDYDYEGDSGAGRWKPGGGGSRFGSTPA